MAGKWRLGRQDDNSPHARGFEETYALMQGAGNHFDGQGATPSEPISTYRQNGKITRRPDGVYSTQLWTDRMLSMIGNRALVIGDWKITLINLGMFGEGRWHLYNLRRDPVEQYPLEYEHPEFFKEMMRAYNAYEKRNRVITLPPNWNPWAA